MAKKNVVRIEQDPDSIVERPILATAIVEMSRSLKSLLKAGLTRSAIIVLVHHNCRATMGYGSKPGISDVREVINQLEELESWAVKRELEARDGDQGGN